MIQTHSTVLATDTVPKFRACIVSGESNVLCLECLDGGGEGGREKI